MKPQSFSLAAGGSEIDLGIYWLDDFYLKQSGATLVTGVEERGDLSGEPWLAHFLNLERRSRRPRGHRFSGDLSRRRIREVPLKGRHGKLREESADFGFSRLQPDVRLEPA